MPRPTGLRGIAYCYFSVHHIDGTRGLKVRRILVLGLVPIVFGVVLAVRLGVPAESTLALIVAVLSVIAAVLIGLLPLAHSILAQSDSERKYLPGERALAAQQITRVQVLQDLHAAVSWAVILLVGGLAACAILVFLIPPFVEKLTTFQKYAQFGLLVLLYGVMTSTALTFFDVAAGVFEAMESYAEALKQKIRNNIDSRREDDVEE
jgi:hypothetical protein